MPRIVPIRDLKNTTAISQICHEDKEPIFVMKNGRYSSLEGSFSYKGRNMAYNVRIMERDYNNLI